MSGNKVPVPPVFSKIQTFHPRIPWGWVPIICLPWVATNYVEGCSRDPMTWVMRRFVEDPRLLSLISSVNVLFNFMVGAIAAYLSDRIWTRFGRRRPFLIVGWLGVAGMMVFIPVAKSFVALIAVIVLYQFFQDVAKPIEPLYNEVIPRPQRGRASIIRTWMQKLSGLFFGSVLIGQFDHQYDFTVLGTRLQFGGDLVIFGVGSILLIGVSTVLFFGVEERPPLHKPEKVSLNILLFFKDIFKDRQSIMVYLLWTAPWITGAAAGSFGSLFQIEQLGFTKVQLGMIHAITMPVDFLLFTTLAGFLTDKVNRVRLLQLGILLTALVNLSLFFYVRYVADYSISIYTFMGFGLVAGFFHAWVFVVWGPVLYDYIPSNRMGTISAGLSIVSGVLGFFIMNLGGLWVDTFTKLFGARGMSVDKVPSPNDYSSIYILNFIMSLVALGILFYFYSQVRKGKVIAYAKIEQKEEEMREKREREAEEQKQ
jgi:Na+/melibiose symporter-like transporter